MTVEDEILRHLAVNEAVLTGSHFIYTGGGHGPAYVNMRAVGHDASWLKWVGEELSGVLQDYDYDIIVGPETLGRTLAQFAAACAGKPGAWCEINDVGGGFKQASFPSKLDFERLVRGKRVAIVDDLLTSGSSISLVVDLITRAGGEVVVAAVVVRRTPDVMAEKCGVPALEVLAEVSGFAVLTQEECEAHGPCSRRVPVVLRPGHGWKWIEKHPDYPTA